MHPSMLCARFTAAGCILAGGQGLERCIQLALRWTLLLLYPEITHITAFHAGSFPDEPEAKTHPFVESYIPAAGEKTSQVFQADALIHLHIVAVAGMDRHMVFGLLYEAVIAVSGDVVG